MFELLHAIGAQAKSIVFRIAARCGNQSLEIDDYTCGICVAKFSSQQLGIAC